MKIYELLATFKIWNRKNGVLRTLEVRFEKK